ncbi:MAG: hypothetical protein R3C01_17830 [Planctomycetaceae bacterium]
MRFIALFVLLGVSPWLCGCSATKGGLGSLSSNLLGGNNGYSDPTIEESSDPWIAETAKEGRPNMEREKSAEAAWFRNLMLSPKAQEIEANVGFE